MTNKFHDPKTAQKNKLDSLKPTFIYNKIFPTIPALLVEGEFVSHFRTKANLIDIFLLQYGH